MLANTNIALFGTELEFKIKQAAAATENAFKGAGQNPGLLKWRIKNFRLEPTHATKSQLVEFFNGDSYIVLHTYTENNALRHDIHFWLGSNTTADEAGTAAYKTVELCELFNREPVQHREEAMYESDQFLAYFEGFGGIRILEGGYESGFHHVEPVNYIARLMQIKGKRVAKTTQVPLDCSSLRTGDVFILDLGKKVYQWNGNGASIRERIRAAQITRALDDERGGAEVCVMEERSEDKDFWTHLVGTPDSIQREATADAETNQNSNIATIWRWNGLAFDKDPTTQLRSDQIYICDSDIGVWVWIGSQSAHQLCPRSDATRYARIFLKDAGCIRPISVIYEGGENELFRTLF